MQDAAVLQERAKVTLVPDEDLQRRLPRRKETVEVVLTDGRRLTQHVVAVRGTVQNPITRDEVVAKAHNLIAPVLGDRKALDLIGRILTLETLKDVTELRPMLSAG